MFCSLYFIWKEGAEDDEAKFVNICSTHATREVQIKKGGEHVLPGRKDKLQHFHHTKEPNGRLRPSRPLHGPLVRAKSIQSLHYMQRPSTPAVGPPKPYCVGVRHPRRHWSHCASAHLVRRDARPLLLRLLWVPQAPPLFCVRVRRDGGLGEGRHDPTAGAPPRLLASRNSNCEGVRRRARSCRPRGDHRLRRRWV